MSTRKCCVSDEEGKCKDDARYGNMCFLHAYMFNQNTKERVLIEWLTDTMKKHETLKGKVKELEKLIEHCTISEGKI
jgi:hypothetical protein